MEEMKDDLLLKIRDMALVPENQPSKYYVDLSYENPGVVRPGKAKKLLSEISYEGEPDPNIRLEGNALEYLENIAMRQNATRDANWQQQLRDRERQEYAQRNTNIQLDNIYRDIGINGRTMTNATIDLLNLTQIFQDTFGGTVDQNDPTERRTWERIYDNLIKPSRVNFPIDSTIEYGSTKTNKAASKLQAAVRRARVQKSRRPAAGL